MLDVVWDWVAIMPDCAFAALGDPRLIGDETWLKFGLPFLEVRRSGLGMVFGQAECDGLPVEVGRRGDEIVAARLEFTIDVAKEERKGRGHWAVMGRLRIGSRGGVALDAKHPNHERWCHRLPLASGWYRAEVFEHRGDHLGIRLVAESVPGEQPVSRF